MHHSSEQESLSFTTPRAELVDPAATIAFMLAGNAHVTFQSRRTSVRFTYRVQAKKLRLEETPGEVAVGSGGPSHFVSVLAGPDHYTYLGCIYGERNYSHGRKSPISKSSPSAFAFKWVWQCLQAGCMHEQLAVYHEGRCGCCGRRLTDPLSISTGLGPKCRGER